MKANPAGARRIEVTPADHGAIQARPCRGLVWHVAHNANRAMLGHGQLLDSRQDAIGQNNLSAHVFVAVIGFMGSVADVYQGGFNIAAWL
jgi:hypothetical protein